MNGFEPVQGVPVGATREAFEAVFVDVAARVMVFVGGAKRFPVAPYRMGLGDEGRKVNVSLNRL